MKSHIRSRSCLGFGILAIIVGMTLMIWPHSILQWTIRLFGVILILLGVIQFLGFMVRTRKETDRWQHFPPTSIIAVLAGMVLLINPDFWASMSAVLCGIVLIALGAAQTASLIRIRRADIRVDWLYYTFPILMIIAGFVVLAQPLFMADWFVIFVGAWIMAYGIVEIFEFFTLREPRKKE